MVIMGRGQTLEFRRSKVSDVISLAWPCWTSRDPFPPSFNVSAGVKLSTCVHHLEECRDEVFWAGEMPLPQCAHSELAARRQCSSIYFVYVCVCVAVLCVARIGAAACPRRHGEVKLFL